MKRMFTLAGSAGLALLSAACPLSPALADAASITVYERSTILRFDLQRLKPLPAGYHHFVQIPWEVRIEVSSNGNNLIVCREMKNAISFGKRLGLGFSPEAAIRELSVAWQGDRPCGYAPAGLRLRPVEYAVRGDDRGRPVSIMRLLDQHGREYFTGDPKDS